MRAVRGVAGCVVGVAAKARWAEKNNPASASQSPGDRSNIALIVASYCIGIGVPPALVTPTPTSVY